MKVDMPERYRKFKRTWGTYYAYDNLTGNSVSLKTRNKAEAVQKVNAMNETERQPSISLGLARVYLIHLPEADDAPRDAMTQPNVYWTLTTPMATIIGLYTNVPEGGRIGPDQLAWFKQELANAPKDIALILALHHPIYSAYGNHPGSQYLKAIIEEATKSANRIPNLILTGHVHDYQRFNGSINGTPVTTLVVGAGGVQPEASQA
jgi:3',5'-cyclic AMP phosphodiesterase CpdA